MCGNLLITPKKVQFYKLQPFRARDDGQPAGILYHGACETSRHPGQVRTVHHRELVMAVVHECLRFGPVGFQSEEGSR